MRLIGRIFNRNKKLQQPITAAIESLESRVMLSGDGPRVTSAQADNRGLTTIFFDSPLLASTVNTNSVQVFTAGPDGILNTSDDVQVAATVIYGAPQQRIIVNANLPVDTAYWVVVRANLVQGADGTPIDGEYTGTFPSGNGTPGGNFRIAATASSSSGNRIARFLIEGQALNVVLASTSQRPIGTPNFLFYVNRGSYDNTVIHRSDVVGANFLQGGGYYISNDPMLAARGHQNGDVLEEGGTNAQGTLAMANKGSADTTENQWFFNVSDNTTAFSGGEYSVIGQVTNASFLPVLNNLDSYNKIDLSTASDPSRFGSPAIYDNFMSVPVTNPNATPDTVDPATDFIFVTRVAIKQIISSMAAFPALANEQTDKTAAASIIALDPVIAGPLFATTIPITSAWATLDPSGSKNLL